MLNARIAIVGGGLGGLYAAALLEARGITDYVLLEARDRFGGRIQSAAEGRARFDLGATWFWPDPQPGLQRLVQGLGLETFEQPESGDMLIERAGSQPERVGGYRAASPAWRMAGSLETLTDALRQRLGAGAHRTGCRVKRLRQQDGHIEVETVDASGQPAAWRVERVLLAVPPRLAAHAIEFVPALPDALLRAWQDCPTWMAPHAKYVAVFDAAFWRGQGLSGEARSAVGPLVEIHDASTLDGDAALFGFLGIPAQARNTIPETDLLFHCRAQLQRLFGDAAGAPKAEFLKDWARDPDTAVAADRTPAMHHAASPPAAAATGAWQGRLVGIASEWSPEFSGYVAGAVDAAQRGVEALLALDLPTHS
jgi:monoamine oxidase